MKIKNIQHLKSKNSPRFLYTIFIIILVINISKIEVFAQSKSISKNTALVANIEKIKKTKATTTTTTTSKVVKKKITKKKSKHDPRVHTKILDSNLIDVTKLNF